MLDIEYLRSYCLAKKGVEEDFPFDEEVLVFKVGGKLFLLTNIYDKPVQFNVKCDPEKAIELRGAHSCVAPGFHMNKKHWNTVTCDGTVPQAVITSWIDHSYALVAGSLPRKIRAELGL